MFLLHNALVVDTDVSPLGTDERGKQYGGDQRAYVLVGREVLRCKVLDTFGTPPKTGDLISAEVLLRPWQMGGGAAQLAVHLVQPVTVEVEGGTASSLAGVLSAAAAA